MKMVAAQTLALLLAGAAFAQTPPLQTPPSAPAGSDLTRDLNAGPPARTVYLTPAPAPPPTSATAATPDSSAVETPAAPGPRATPASAPGSTPGSTPASPPQADPAAGHLLKRTTPGPVAPAPGAPAAAVPPPRAEPRADLAPETAAAPSPTVPPAVTVLDAAARAALPFSIELPPGFEIVTGRPGPDFHIYTIRRGDRSFAMIYAGPASQFPIYSGQMIEAGGRASVVSTENGVRHAQEHLFQRAAAPREIHVWTMSLDGADRALAERIAQSLDVR